jgi:DMSO/TMAO reductase YedYZ heme-binding membrane subunit
VFAFLVSIASIVWFKEAIVTFIVRGYVGYSMFLVVMMVGVLPNKWTISRNIKKYRGVLSILGFVLITPHAFLHVFGFLDDVNLFGIIAYVLMVPLTIISFQIIKKEISPQDWLTVQKAAYIIYGALFLHLIVVADWFDKIIYAVLLVLYLNNKLYKEFRK